MEEKCHDGIELFIGMYDTFLLKFYVSLSIDNFTLYDELMFKNRKRMKKLIKNNLQLQ